MILKIRSDSAAVSTFKFSFCQYVCELFFGVNKFDLILGVGFDYSYQPREKQLCVFWEQVSLSLFLTHPTDWNKREQTCAFRKHNVPPEIDCGSSESFAKSESLNSPNLHFFAPFPT